MRKTIGGIAMVLGTASLAACAQTPRLDIVKTGALPIAASSFALVEGPDSPSRAILSACLASHSVSLSARPTYLAQVSEADRPRSVGAAERVRPNAGKGKPQWLPGAAPDRRRVRSLAFTLTQASTGREVYRIIVSERYSSRPNRLEPANLAKAACENLAGPAS